MTALLLLFFLQAVEVTLPDGRTFSGRADTKNEAAKAEKLAADPTAANLLAAARIYDELWWFSKSIEIYTRGMEMFPGDFRFPRFRGHRRLSTRRFGDGAADLEAARRLAPDSFDVAYHLGLAYYLQGEFAKAAEAYGRCLDAAGKPPAGAPLPEGVRGCHELDRQDNSRAALVEWLYRSLRRAGRHGDAARLLDGIREGMSVSTNATYYQTLLYYKGLRAEASLLPSRGAAEGNTFSTSAYGVAVHHLVEGRKARACELLRAIVQEKAWNAFGLIAAESDLARGVCR